MSRLSALFHYYFNLDRDKDQEHEVVASITKGISFRGTNLWTLIFAIIIASVGLNVNSTAVIIGAMLISPLMGPIMGVGLGIGISDSALVRRGLKNLTIAVVISIATSAAYFYITPLHTANSELLARTTPTIWDVFIAFAGGLAGVVGATRREKSNVIPGVAIATALMPPLCTVGFGLATGHWYYALGAFYLFFINSVFICVATVLIVRFMGFHKHVFEDEASRRRMTRYILLVVIVTTAPSIWLAYRIVQKAVFEGSAQSFVRRELKYAGTQVISKNFVFDAKKPRIELLLIGDVLDAAQVDTLRSHLPAYNLKGTDLVIRQGLNAQKQLDLAQLRAGLLDEVFSRGDTARVVAAPPPAPPPLPDVRAELKALYPQVAAYSLHKVTVVRTDTVKKSDSVILFVAGVSGKLSSADQQRMQRWLSAKFPQDSVQVGFRPER